MQVHGVCLLQNSSSAHLNVYAATDRARLGPVVEYLPLEAFSIPVLAL